MTVANTEQAERWSQQAPVWLELEDQLEEVTGPPGRLAMDRLELLPGQAVVDLGCGTGRTTLELAARVGPGGDVLGVDIAAEMLGRGRDRVAQMGLRRVDFVQADVQAADLGGGRFDAAYSRFGVMFFSDPVAALANVRKALRPGGTLSFVCWKSPSDNEWMLVPGTAVASVLGSPLPTPAPGEPGPCSLADPDRVRSVLGEAGFGGIDIAHHGDFVVIPEGRISEIALTNTRVGPVREALRDADEQTRDRARAAIEAAWRARLEDGRVSAARGVLLVVARA